MFKIFPLVFSLVSFSLSSEPVGEFIQATVHADGDLSYSASTADNKNDSRYQNEKYKSSTPYSSEEKEKNNDNSVWSFVDLFSSRKSRNAAKLWSANAFHNLKEWAFGGQCPFVEKPVDSLEYVLNEKIVAQPLAINLINTAFSVWNMNRSNGISEPLVLAFTGPTGVGKTETANVIGEAIFMLRDQLSKNSSRTLPRGLLILRGEDFSDPNASITTYHARIKSRVASHLRGCSGNALIIFDEVQKVVPGTLDVLLEAMDATRPRLTYHKEGSDIVFSSSCENVAWILISDIGVPGIKKLLLQYPRGKTPENKLVAVVKSALDKQWERLRFGKMIGHVVPFLPLEPFDIRHVTSLKLTQLGVQLEGKFWHSFSFDENVSTFLSLQKFIHYEVYHGVKEKRIYAKYGARNVVVGGPLSKIKALLSLQLVKNRVTVKQSVKLNWNPKEIKPSQYSRVCQIEEEKGNVPVPPLILSACDMNCKENNACQEGTCKVIWTGGI
eukprot:g6189.t1